MVDIIELKLIQFGELFVFIYTHISLKTYFS